MEAPTETVERLYAALEADDIATFLDLCADEVEVIYPAGGTLPYGGRWHGLDGMKGFLDSHEAAEEILELTVSRMTADGTEVFVSGHFGGRARDTGREWSTDFVHLMKVTDGRLVRWQALFDTGAAVAAHRSRETDAAPPFATEPPRVPGRSARQHATVSTMIDIARGMAMQTMRIARRDVVEVGDVKLSDEEDATLAESLLHIEQAATDLRQLRGGEVG